MGKELVTEDQVIKLADTMIEVVDELGRKISVTQSGIQGAIVPTSIAPTEKGMYPIAEPGVYTNFKDSNGQPILITQEEFESGMVFIVFSGTSSAKVITPIPANGNIEEGDKRAVSGQEVYDYAGFKTTESSNILNPEYIVLGKSVASNGYIGNSSTITSIIGFPVSDLTEITLSGNNPSAARYYSFMNYLNEIVEVGVATSPLSVVVPSLATKFNATVMNYPETSDFLRINKGLISLPYESYYTVVNEVNKKKIEASFLSTENKTPDPESDENAINKRHFDLIALKNSDIKLVPTNNLANPSLIQHGKYITNNGSIASVLGWAMIVIPIDFLEVGRAITFGRFTINTAGYSAFRNSEGLVEYLGMHDILPKTVIKPEGATHLYIDIKRPIDDGSNYAQLTVNLGSELLPYESPILKIDTLAGYPFNISGDGGSFDQSLNTTDEVSFAKIIAPIESSVLILNLPNSPDGLPANRAWIDRNNDNVIKVTE